MNTICIDEVELQRLKNAEQILRKVRDAITLTDIGMPRLEASTLLAGILMFFEE